MDLCQCLDEESLGESSSPNGQTARCLHQGQRDRLAQTISRQEPVDQVLQQVKDTVTKMLVLVTERTGGLEGPSVFFTVTMYVCREIDGR
jgi:hypothetical protein